MAAMSQEIAVLLHMIDSAFSRKAWHGPNLRGSLRGLTAEQASWRPGPRRHNVWEIALHCAYWKYAVWRRLCGVKRGSFPLKGSNWFARPGVAPNVEQAWQADLELLGELHVKLRAEIAALDPKKLSARSKGSKSSNLELIAGIGAHDLYHAGQIQLLKRLRTGADFGTTPSNSI
jgi:hypothetical protein